MVRADILKEEVIRMKIEPNKIDKDGNAGPHSLDTDGKLTEIKKQISSGNYKVDTVKLAQKILESGVLDD